MKFDARVAIGPRRLSELRGGGSMTSETDRYSEFVAPGL
jgi:hypothetical protein